ncbi:MAG: exosortase system-associated protein, TIGR04073 family [bacterium]|nr:exosortase system-associated protein, TIGR04073 family [bacterium]
MIHRRSRVRILAAAALCAALAPGILGAQQPVVQQPQVQTADLFARDASGKFGRGIVNLATGWGELLRCPAEIARERGRLLGATWGPLKGIAMTILRTGCGAIETVLFFYPLPGNYDPLLRPEFVWPGDVFLGNAPPEPAP